VKKRVVITSVGVISSLGNGLNAILDSLKQDRTNFVSSDVIPDQLVCPVPDFNIKEFTGRFKNARYLNRGAQFTVAAALEAVRHSRLPKTQWQSAGIFLGGGPNLDMEGEFPGLGEEAIDWQQISALWLLRFLPNTAASVIAGILGTHGASLSLGTACAASLQAIGEAYRKIKDGYLTLALAGGGDSRLSSGGLQGYKKAQALFQQGQDPEKKYIPFATERSGFVPGEGGAVFLLEELEHAQQRQATILGEICGFGASMDGYQMTAPHPEGTWGKEAVFQAIGEASCSVEDIEVISTHGTGTQLNDAMEAQLIASLCLPHKPLLLALKSWVGHLAAACGAMELAISLACLRDGFLPGIRHLQNSNAPKLNFCQHSRSHHFSRMLLQNFGFGGQNAALMVKQWQN